MFIEPKAYAAFISYRHTARDREWAIRMFEALETYRTPKTLQKQGYPAQLGKLFRDEDEIPASADLSDQIKHALAHSSVLIVVCSPETPKSKWVRREIALFQEMGKGDRIIPLLIAGEPDESFPPEILSRTVESAMPDGTIAERSQEIEPIAADVRPRKDEPHSKTFQRAELRIAAAILGVAYDDLYRRQHERERAFLRRLAGAAAATVLLTAGGAYWAYDTYFAIKVQYCANYGERWGVPFCVGEMSEFSGSQAGGGLQNQKQGRAAARTEQPQRLALSP